MFDLHVFKAIWRIRTLKKGLHVFRGTQSNQSHLLVDAVDALGRVAEALKCEELVQWTKNELDGYAAVETVPAYRHVGCEYRGDALKCGQALQKDYLLPEEVWRQHLPVTNNTFEYKGGLSAMLDIVRDSTQATCVLRSYRDFQVVNVYNLQAGYEVIGPRCVCSRHDVRKALGLYEKSASQGCANAQFEMGMKFDQGEGCEKNEIRAFECFGKAAAQGHQIAIYNLGLCYEYGRGVERDLKKAEECFQDAQDGTEKRISDLALEALGRLENEKLPWWQRIAPWRW